MDAEAIREIFQEFGPVSIRRMFGGQGVYREGMMFALEVSGELYLKTDAESVAVFRERGSRPFAYASKNGRTTVMSYWLMPESALEEPDEAAGLARLALEAARRSKSASAKKAKTSAPFGERGKPH